MSRGMRARSPPHLGGAVLSRIRPQIEKCASAVDVRTMAIQDCAQIRIQDLVAYARRQCLKFSHDPSLPAIEKGESVERTGNGQPLCIQAAGRSEERRVGKECVSTCRSRRVPIHLKTKKITN